MDEPRILRSGPPESAAEEPGPEPKSTPMPTPEQRAAIEAVLEGRIDEVAPRRCTSCSSRECVPVYALVEHSAIALQQTNKFMRTESIERSRIEPYAFPMCAACYQQVDATRRRGRIAAYGAGAGLVIAMGYFVAALASAPTAISLGLLFGGGGLLAAMMIVAVASTRSLHRRLCLPALPGMTLLGVSTSRADISRLLARRQRISHEIENRLDRLALDAAAPPAARLVRAPTEK